MPETASPAAAPPASRLKHHVIRGSAWTLGGFTITYGLRFGGNVAIAWLLTYRGADATALLGMMALVNMVMEAMAMLSESGAATALIQHPRGQEPSFLNTGWTIQIVRGFLMCAGANLVAWPMAAYTGQPILGPAISVTSLGLLIISFSSARIILFRRNLHLGKITFIEITRQTVGVSTMLVWAWFSADIWALVAANLASNATTLILSYAFPPRIKQRLQWDRQAVREIWRFGRWVFLSTIMTMIALYADRFVLGGLGDIGFVGVYAAALTFAGVVPQMAQQMTAKVVYPSLSRVNREDPERVRQAYYRTRRFLDPLLQAPCGFFVIAGPLIFEIFYPEKFHGGGWVLQLLAIRSAMIALITPCEAAMWSRGDSYYVFLRNFCRAVCVCVGMPLGYAWGGIEGLVWVVALSDTLPLMVVWFGATRHGLLNLGREMWAVASFVGGVTLGLAVVGVYQIVTG